MGYLEFQTIGDLSKAYLVLLLFAGLLLLALLQYLVRGRQPSVVLVLGSSGAGKTTLFHQLRDGNLHEGTVPSMQYNKDTIQLPSSKDGTKRAVKPVVLVDVPGHPKVRGTAAQFYRDTRLVLFLVDAVDFMAQKTGVAELLYEVISDSVIQRKKIPILLVCNKTDEGARAHTADFVQKRLEKELEALRTTRSTLGDGAVQGQPIAKKGEVFTFAGLKSNKISIASASALTNNLEEVLNFLR